MPALDPTTRDEVPAASAELSLIRTLVEAYILTLDRDEAVAYLTNVAKIMSAQEEAWRVVRIRRTAGQLNAEQAERMALAAFRSMLEVWLVRLRT